eukprot:134631-Amphidinium_carterae.1
MPAHMTDNSQELSGTHRMPLSPLKSKVDSHTEFEPVIKRTNVLASLYLCAVGNNLTEKEKMQVIRSRQFFNPIFKGVSLLQAMFNTFNSMRQPTDGTRRVDR